MLHAGASFAHRSRLKKAPFRAVVSYGPRPLEERHPLNDQASRTAASAPEIGARRIRVSCAGLLYLGSIAGFYLAPFAPRASIAPLAGIAPLVCVLWGVRCWPFAFAGVLLACLVAGL